MKRAVLYLRVSTLDQVPGTQRLDLVELARHRGFEIVEEYVDHGYSGARTRRPALDRMMSDASKRKFDVLLVWAADRVARSTKHFLDVLSELDHLGIAFISYREQIDSSGPLGRAIMTIVAAIAELERSLIIERVRAGMRRARLEGRHIGRNPLELDEAGIRADRARGMSLRQVAKAHRVSTGTVRRVLSNTRLGGTHEHQQLQHSG